jgi:glutathione S-transferase
VSAPGHILYTFRRCPYAMRGRMGLSMAGLPVHVREVVLRDKPADMLAASPKGTVPVLVTTSGEVVDESLDIMRWALAQKDAAREAGLDILRDLNSRLEAHGGQLVRPTRSLADMAIFPFVRQYAHTDMDWFRAQDLPALQVWLDGHKQSALFKSVMAKYAQWEPGSDEPLLPAAA